MTHDEENDIWTPKDVANYLKVCDRYVAEKLAKQKGFPLRLPVGRLRWFREEILAWADQARGQYQSRSHDSKYSAKSKDHDGQKHAQAA